MKILHTADWHLGIELYRVSMLEDQRYFFQQLKQIVMTEKVDVVVISGDIFDTMLASREAIALYDDMVTELCLYQHKEVIVIAGNHDSSTRLSNCSRLLKPMGLHVIGRIDKPINGITIKDTVFYPIPYFHCEQVAHAYGSAVRNMEDAFQLMISGIQASFQDQKHHVLLAHAFVNGASPSQSDRFAQIGGSDLVSSTVLQGFDYVALGHLHRVQSMNDVIWYSGSPLAYSFQEAEYEKCVLLYDTETKEISRQRIQPLHKLQSFKGTLAEMQHIEAEHDAYLRFEITDTPVSYEMLAFFRERYDNLLQISGIDKKEDQLVSLAINDIEHISDEDLLQHFFEDTLQEELDEDAKKLFQEALVVALKEESDAS